MKPLLIWALLMFFLIAGLMGKFLPSPIHHRHAAELTPIAVSPPRACPGQYPLYTEDADGNSYFLECWGKR